MTPANVEEETRLREDLRFLTRSRRDHPFSPVETSKDTDAIRAVDLFCGAGGLTLGLKEACRELGLGFEAFWAVDSEPRTLAVYKSNFKPRWVSRQPIQKHFPGPLGAPLRLSEKHWRSRLTQVDWLLAGPPCQGHSALNNHTRHQDDRNHLYTRVARCAEVIQPRWILIENVPSVVHDRKKAIQQTIKHLKSLSYTVDSLVVDLSTLGVPQRRKRNIVMASREGKPTLKKWAEKNSVKPRPIAWAIRDLEREVQSGLLNTAPVLSNENQRRIQYLFDHNLDDLPDLERPECHQNGDHKYKSMYGRLSWNDLAQTITTGFGSPGQGRYVHPSQKRTLTPREAARLQFLPDSLDLSMVEYRSLLARLIGNAVPPKLSWVFCKEMMS